MASIEEIEKRRAERRANHEGGQREQLAKDLEAIDKLEEASGEPLQTMSTNSYKPGVPVKIAFRAPSALEYKRYCDQANKALGKGDHTARLKAQELLAESCIEYPEKGDARKAMLEAFPGVLVSLAIEAAKMAELRAEDEGKG